MILFKREESIMSPVRVCHGRFALICTMAVLHQGNLSTLWHYLVNSSANWGSGGMKPFVEVDQ